MAPVWYRFGAELRGRWKAWVALGLLLGVIGGIVMAATAGARRTASAYPRFLSQSEAADVTVDVFGEDIGAFPWDEVAALPGVQAAGSYSGVIAAGEGPDGFLAPPPGDLVASDGRRFYDFDRPKVSRGRMPDPEVATEAFVNETAAAEIGLDVGGTIRLRAPGPADLARFSEETSFEEIMAADREGPRVGTPVEVTVTGVGVLNDDVASDESGLSSGILLPPAFVERYELATTYSLLALQLEPGADRAALAGTIRDLGGDDYRVQLKDVADVTRPVQRAIRPYAVALGAFALLAGLAGLLVAGQAVARQAALDASDDRDLGSMGLAGRQVGLLSVLRSVPVAVVTVATALAVAVAASPLFPVGPARVAEPDRGLSLDVLVLAVGATSLAVFAVAVSWGAAALARRRSARVNGETGVWRAADAAAAVGAPPTAVIGVGFALGAGRSESTPVRTTLAGMVLGVAACLAVVTFAAGLDRLVDTPRLYGWGWDVVLGSNGGYVDVPTDEIDARLAPDRGVTGWTHVAYGAVDVDGVELPSLGLGMVKGSVHPPLLEGRAPRHGAEVILGTTSMRELGVDVGDTVTLGGQGSVEATVVGRAVFPALGFHDAERPGLGEGVAAPLATLVALADAYPNAVLVDVVEGAAGEQALAGLARDFPPGAVEGLESIGAQKPGDVAAFGELRWTTVVLSGLLALAAMGVLAHALVATGRRRRRELAVLSSLGLVRRQVSAVLAWQATAVALAGVLVGVPLGLAGGRWAWRLFVERLGVGAGDVTPVVVLALAVPATVVLANLVAVFPARSAGSDRPAVTLRTE